MREAGGNIFKFKLKGQGDLVCCSAWSHKESDNSVTEQVKELSEENAKA